MIINIGMKEYNDSFSKKGETLYLISSDDVFDYLKDCIRVGFITSMRLINEKGIFDTLKECCVENRLGFDITSDSDLTDDEFLYGKTKYLAVVSVNADQEDDFVDFLFSNKISLTLLGHVTKGELRMDGNSFGFISDYIK